MSRRPKKWGDMPSSSELGALVKCEVEFCHERDTGQERNDVETRAASDRGKREHDRAQVRMETFHNRPRPAPGTGKPSSSAPDRRCFVASAAFGPDAPETSALRSFRDRRLLPSAVGRGFVAVYYRLSPPLARVVGSSPLLASASRRVLGLIVRLVS